MPNKSDLISTYVFVYLKVVLGSFSIIIRPFEKRSYYFIPLDVRPSDRLSVRPDVNFSFPDNSSYSLRSIELKLGI